MTNKPKFIRDLEKRQLTMELVLAAPRARVWQAYTDPDLLPKWWGTHEWPTTYSKSDFRVGGHWHYCMTSPDGTQSWGRADYLAIEPEKSLTATDAFSDESGAVNPDMPLAEWTLTLEDHPEGTRMRVVTTYATQAALQQVLEMGVETGYGETMERLADFLAESAS